MQCESSTPIGEGSDLIAFIYTVKIIWLIEVASRKAQTFTDRGCITGILTEETVPFGINTFRDFNNFKTKNHPSVCLLRSLVANSFRSGYSIAHGRNNNKCWSSFLFA